eukprot:m.260939 g.260939  ORF g.260939 m.260939 type:complete len:327 (-) comp40907_c0_seq1:75-1055(-)
MSTAYVDAAVKFFTTKVKDKNGVAKSCHRNKVHSIEWNANGSRLGSASADKTAAMHSIQGSRLVRELELVGHTDSVDQLCWNPTNESMMATVSSDKTLRIWDARSGSKAIQVVKNKYESINLAWSKDGSTLAFGTEDDEVVFMSTKNYKEIRKKRFPYEINEMGWNQEGDLFLLSTGTGNIVVLDYENMDDTVSPSTEIAGHTANIQSLEFDREGKYFATGGADALVALWHATELVCVRTFSATEWPIRGLSFSFDGQLLAAASESSSILLTYVETGEVVHKLETPDGSFCVAWHPTQMILAFAYEDKAGHRDDSGIISLFGGNSK